MEEGSNSAEEARVRDFQKLASVEEKHLKGCS
jgi:hypothetical protein